MKRCSGVLLPIFSLPSPYGIGTLGKAAYDWIDFLHEAGQQLWQVLPIGPTSFGDSPYQSFSAFAGNPYFIDLEQLIEAGLLTEEECQMADFGSDDRDIDYGKIYENRFPLLKKAFLRWEEQQKKAGLDEKEIRKYLKKQLRAETRDYCFYMALKNQFGGKSFSEWDKDIRTREDDALKHYKKELREEIAFYEFQQMIFEKQWKALKTYANERGIRIIGDIPIYVALDSADVWTHPELFLLDEENLTPLKVAGVPPDAFSETGQLWGNPLYRWDVQEKTDFAWWKERMKASARLYDVVRIDHFIGVTQYYAIPAGSEDGKTGEWLKGPGKKLTDAINMVIGDTKIIAEDLGIFVPEVKELLEETGYPGMKIIEFAFSGDRFNEHLPHMYSPNSVVYGGTHDNETLVGYFKPEARQWWELQYIADYMGVSHQHEVVDKVLKTAYASVASVVIFQAQDILKLDSWARMNTPGTVGNNWRWRMKPGELTQDHINHLSWLVDTFGRF